MKELETRSEIKHSVIEDIPVPTSFVTIKNNEKVSIRSEEFAEEQLIFEERKVEIKEDYAAWY